MFGGNLHGDLSGSRNLVCGTFYSPDASTYDGAALESPSHVAEEKVGVLLLNLGGPETLNDVQPFLFNLFADPVCFFFHFYCFTRVFFSVCVGSSLVFISIHSYNL